MGIGRFAFTPLLPMMQADAGLSLAHGGWLATSNYAGYLAGALWAAAHSTRAHVAIRAGLLAIGLTTLAMGVVGNVAAWLLLRFAAGVASAWVLVHVSGWALGRLAPLGRPLLNGAVYAGVGAGIALTGLLCLAAMYLAASSSTTWIVLGGVSVGLAALAWSRVGEASPPAGAASTPAGDRGSHPRLVLCYGILGFGYIIPATYLPAMARDALGDPALFGWAWPVFGVAAAASTLGVAPLLARIDNRRVWAASHLTMAAGVAAPLLVSGLAGIVVSSLCVGGTFMVATMTGLQEARKAGGPRAARLMAAMTAAFAAGQIVGPVFVTALVGSGGKPDWALAVASTLLAGTGVLLYGKRRP